jgi:hypothetical protein
MKTDLRAKDVSIVGPEPSVDLTLVDGVRVSFPVDRIQSFRRRAIPRRALRDRADELFDVKVEDGGFTIEWPTLDVDFSVAEMLPEYLGITTAAAVARKAGSAKTPAKAAAARANGAQGGRPRSKVRRSGG